MRILYRINFYFRSVFNKYVCMLVNKLLFSSAAVPAAASAITASKAPVIYSSQHHKIKHEAAFHDLNKNRKTNLYKDAKQSIEATINNLLTQMTIEEKAGMQALSKKSNT